MLDISVGSITIRTKPSTVLQLVRARNFGKRGVIALADALTEPGTPIFSTDPQDPQLVIRELDGRVARGYFKAGKFIEVP
ncbi:MULTISPECIES: hypothetical protein [unclassified Duganella]|uniref:hypothetical protein n=1 Tax=unclassified Duganella TaxID=2636909 RepID=UPI000E342CD9|nr:MULTISPECIES: hypothetical protein [unclassified Duganella]RFP12782.1 hypothetical protein D0T23_16955 [Duganella sp. BJB475]RFP28791.1 hypothetical protein D0T21_20940 [Duganella sp. BJB476]